MHNNINSNLDVINVSNYIQNNFLKIVVKTNSNKTEVTGYDKSRNALKLNVASLPIEGRANIEIIKFFKKQYKLNIEIKSGKTSKEKLLKIL